ncbi:MAG: hypothetical protein JO202_02930 [Ktedonobacteraceae bacterium]|nr:hypothetical protein [Ktedonobacteraceae bacterium]
MPKRADYQIRWSPAYQSYELRHGTLCCVLTSDAELQWWLSYVAETMHFCARSGHTLTLRVETKQRGDRYWYAYKRVGQVVHEKYLGAESTITLALLEEVAQCLGEPAPSPKPPPPPRQPVRLKFTRSLESALRIYGFAKVPTKHALQERYRALSKQHRPDRGGLHQDMVAVNLAYDYLQKFVEERH